MDALFMEKMDALRGWLRFALPVTSGDRCEAHNAAAGGGDLSGHLDGRAADINVWGMRAFLVVVVAGLTVALERLRLRRGFAWLKYVLPRLPKCRFTGIGISQRSGSPTSQRFVHLDDLEDSPGRPRPRIWTY
jgi:hypothetical protein